jgi:DNA-binding MarR family transcriptional regulator
MSTALTIVRLSKLVEITLADLGLTVNQYRMLTFIDEGAPSVREVGQRLAMKPPNVSTLVDGLVSRGLATRARHDDDARRWSLTLTAAGAELLVEAERRADQTLTYVLANRADRDSLREGLDEWEPVLDQLGTDLRASLEGGRRTRSSSAPLRA